MRKVDGWKTLTQPIAPISMPEESTWFSEGGEENYSGGFWKYSKRFKELTLEGSFKAEDLLIAVSKRRAFSASGYHWPAARIANLTSSKP